MTIMIPEMVLNYAQKRALAQQDALQTFLQIVVLKNLRHEEARLIGGTALVFGHGNPRFSEDIDLGQVQDPMDLEPSLVRGTQELKQWLAAEALLSRPSSGSATWVISVQMEPKRSLRLHVDSQRYAAHSTSPIVVQFPTFTPFVVSSVSMDEIMADKLVALALRRYLSGRDLFDLWFHWLRDSSAAKGLGEIQSMVVKKLSQRRVPYEDWIHQLKTRLGSMELSRAKSEWSRYLPQEFNRSDVLEDIALKARQLPDWMRGL